MCIYIEYKCLALHARQLELFLNDKNAFSIVLFRFVFVRVESLTQQEKAKPNREIMCIVYVILFGVYLLHGNNNATNTSILFLYILVQYYVEFKRYFFIFHVILTIKIKNKSYIIIIFFILDI